MPRSYRDYRATLRATYSSPLGWFGLVVLTGVLAYGGGAVMYWFHAIYRGEVGPDIPHVVHWALDSTIGFAGLLPAVFLIMPVALRLVQPDVKPDASTAARTIAFTGVVGALFSVATGPGPFLHNLIAGPATPLGRWMTHLFNGTVQTGPQPHGAVAEGLLQVAVGLPTYVVMAALGVAIVRAATGRVVRRRVGVAEAQAA